MAKICLLLCVSITLLWGALGVHSAAPAPTQDCTTVLLAMTDCLSFVATGSNVQKPEGGCCPGLQKVLKTAPECLCESFKNSRQLGISFNVSRSINLPSACGIKAPPFSECGIALAPPPGPSLPGHAPKSLPKSPMTPGLSSTLIPSKSSDAPKSNESEGTPVQNIPMSGTSAMPISFVVLFCMIIATYSHIYIV
ncbi:hypothetical protein ACHQM5_022406 [Ranunculus cassubicifolius]